MSVQRRDSRWRVRWREDGNMRSRTFDRRRDAEAWDREVARRRQLGPLAVEQMTTTGPTLGQWITSRWHPEHGVSLAPTTLARYANSYTVHAAELDDLPLAELTVARLRAWQAGRLKDGASPDALVKVRTFLSSVLRHAAESEAIPANPLALVRAPRTVQAGEVRPLAPATVEKIRAALLDDRQRSIPASRPGQRHRAAHAVPARAEHDRRRDALLISLMAYAGLRPGEARGLRFDDIRDRTLLIERSADKHGKAQPVKTRAARSVRLLAPLASELREQRMLRGRPAGHDPVLAHQDGRPLTGEDFANFRARAWRTACEAAGLDLVPRPYDLRHSCASLLLAEGRTVHYVARQLGHSPALTLSTYGHVMSEYEDSDRIDAEAEIDQARRAGCAHFVPIAAG